MSTLNEVVDFSKVAQINREENSRQFDELKQVFERFLDRYDYRVRDCVCYSKGQATKFSIEAHKAIKECIERLNDITFKEIG